MPVIRSQGKPGEKMVRVQDHSDQKPFTVVKNQKTQTRRQQAEASDLNHPGWVTSWSSTSRGTGRR